MEHYQLTVSRYGLYGMLQGDLEGRVMCVDGEVSQLKVYHGAISSRLDHFAAEVHTPFVV